MPLSESPTWEILAKWALGIVGTVAVWVGILSRQWARDRFDALEVKIKAVDKKAKENAARLAEHDLAIAQITSDLKHLVKTTDKTYEDVAEMKTALTQHIASG